MWHQWCKFTAFSPLLLSAAGLAVICGNRLKINIECSIKVNCPSGWFLALTLCHLCLSSASNPSDNADAICNNRQVILMVLIILMMVLVIGDNAVDLANINFAAVHSIQSFDLLVKQNLVKYLKPRQFSTDIIATLKIWSMLPVRSPSISPFCFLVSALKMKKRNFFFFFLFFTTMFR